MPEIDGVINITQNFENDKLKELTNGRKKS